MWQQFRQSMLQSRSKNEEVIGFLFGDRQKINKRQFRYIPKNWIVPLPDCYEHQSISGIVLKQEFHQFLLETQLKNHKLDVVHIHTHLGEEMPSFSAVDDRYEPEYAQLLATNFKHKPRLISGVFNSDLQQGKLRICNRQGSNFSEVNFSNSWLEILPSQDNLMFSRQKIFGDGVQNWLKTNPESLLNSDCYFCSSEASLNTNLSQQIEEIFKVSSSYVL